MSDELKSFILSNFQTAVKKRHIRPYYQPVIRTISQRLCSFEALARWVDPEKGVIRPDQFIPVLEQENLIHLLDQCVIRQVCEQLRRNLDAGTLIPVSVNLSRLDFLLCDIYSVVDQMMTQYHLPHDILYIEITESTMAEHEELMRDVVDRFRSSGYQVWMDDFGSAYSTLNTLKDYSFDELKIDMRFLSTFSRRSRRILSAIIMMAKNIGIHTLTEGVETEEQFHFLRNIGCEKVQGYYFGRPLPYEESLAHLSETGIPVENALDRKYYDEIGQVNLLSAVPFMSQEERDSLSTAREMSSIPLAMLEIAKTYFSLLFSNAAFEQASLGTGIIPDVGSQEMLSVPQPVSLLPHQVRDLLDSAAEGVPGRMNFIANDQYYLIQAKCVSRAKDRYCVLMSVMNLSKDTESEHIGQLDDSLRKVYSLFERITLVDVEEDKIEPIFVDALSHMVSRSSGIRTLAEEYAKNWIFPDDQEEYLALMDFDTIDTRLKEADSPYVSACLRSWIGHGRYAWKQYTILHLQDRHYLILIRNIHHMVLRFMKQHGKPAETLREEAGSLINSDLLWKNLIESDIIHLFWKDRERRFLGASKAFLEYYEFPSVDVILGKNDEEVGWHVHPDKYMNDEYQVINEGRVIRNMPGKCIRRGENRDILANKTPLYDDNGEIQGLVGYFIDRDLLNANDARGGDFARRDLMTGLLNERGLIEEAQAFQEEYFIRGVDFVRIHVTIDGFPSLVQQLGFEFSDKVLVALGKALKEEFGQNSAIARYAGQTFVILRQIGSSEEAQMLRSRIKGIATSLRRIDGVAVTLYLSVGYGIFSAVKDLAEQSKLAENSLLVDHDDNTSAELLIQRTSELFSLYDDLPIPFAVYRVIVNEEGMVTDALLFYANRSFAASAGMPVSSLLGQSTRKMFPELNEKWYELAGRASSGGESIVDRFYYEPENRCYHITVNQVIHSGYCAFTYLALDLHDPGHP